jgi:hypothetical protein
MPTMCNQPVQKTCDQPVPVTFMYQQKLTVCDMYVLEIVYVHDLSILHPAYVHDLRILQPTYAF